METNIEMTDLQNMETKNSFKLIDGKFAPHEAAKVIFALINSKINYHNLDAFSNEIRFQKQVTNSVKRVEDLRASNKAIRTLLNEASKQGLEVIVNSSIDLTFISEKGEKTTVSVSHDYDSEHLEISE